MVTSQSLFGNSGQQDNKGTSKFKSLFSTNEEKKEGLTTDDITPSSIKESLQDVEGSKYGFTGTLVNDVKGFFGDIGDLVSYGWTELVSNKDKKKGINDWDEYKKRMKQMSQTETADEYNALYNKMVSDKVIDKDKFEQYQADEKAGKYYKFEEVKSLDKQKFFNDLDNALAPIMSNTTNRYQIDSLSKGVKKIEDQYSMFYDNVMDTYKDTRDERILDEWNKIRAEYENDILQFTKNWAENLVGNNMTFAKAYSKTLGEGSNEAFANGISKIERDLTNKMYKFTINKNLTDAGNASSTVNLLGAIDQTLLATKNGITWGVKQVSNLLEETKQLAGRYDVVEELMNLRVFDEDASGLQKAIGNAGWFVNTMIDSLPSYGPAVIELVLARKVEGSVLKNTDKLMDLWKAGNFKRFGTTLGGATLKELALDNLIYDEVFQNMVGRPISNEDENINLMFNLPLDFLQGALQANAKWFKPGMKAADFVMDRISNTMLKMIKTSGDTPEDLTKLAEKVYLLRGLETTEGTKEAKAIKRGETTSMESIKTDTKLYNKVTKALNDASGYRERLSQYKGGVEDMLLGLQEKMSTKEIKKLSTLEQLDKASQLVYGQSKFMQEAGDSLMWGAKSIGKTIGDLLINGSITSDELKTIIKAISNISGIDDLVLGLATGNKELVNNTLVSFSKRGVEMSSSEVNKLYNNIFGRILKDKPELKEFDQIGTYFKGNDGMYRNVLGDDTRYTVEEMIDILNKTSDGKVYGNEQTILMESMNKKLSMMAKERVANSGNAAIEQDVTAVFAGLRGGNIFRVWDDKSVAEKKMISQIMHDAGLKIKIGKDEAGNDIGGVQVFGTYDGLLKLRSNIAAVAGGKPLNQFTAEDLAAYKMYYASDFIDSFNKYLFKVGDINSVDKSLLEKGQNSPHYNSADFSKEYKSWFESLFDSRIVKDQNGNDQKIYKVKNAFDTQEIANQFSALMTNSATFKEVESYAAQNIIKDIAHQVMLSDETDAEIYNAIDSAITKGRYVKGYKREITPIVNSLFNQVKWLGSMGMNESDSAELLGRLFGELVVDEGTLRTLSRIDSDYLYKGIISKLLLGDESSTALYADSLNKLFTELSPEAKFDLKNAMANVEVLGSKINTRRKIEEAKVKLESETKAIDKRIEKIQSKVEGKNSKRVKKEIVELEEKKAKLKEDFNKDYGSYFNKKGVLTLNEPVAIDLDRTALLNKLQGYTDDIKPVEFNRKIESLDFNIKKRMKIDTSKKGTTVSLTKDNVEVKINRIVGASNEDLKLISDLAAFKAFEKANLPLYGEASKMSESMYNQLMALKIGGDTRKIVFSTGKTELEEGVINLGLLGEAKILSNIFSPEGLKYVVGNMLTSKITQEGLPEWMEASRAMAKNIIKKSKMDNIGKEYLVMLDGVEKYIKYGDDAKEQIKSIIDTLEGSALLDKNIVIDDLIKSYNNSKEQGERGLLLNNSFIQQLQSAINKLNTTISDIYTTKMLYDNILSSEDKKRMVDILKKLDDTEQTFSRMRAMATTSKELTEQDIKKVLTTDFSVIELEKKDDLINKGLSILDLPKRSRNIEINKLRETGTNERVDDFNVKDPPYHLGNKKLIIYDLETTSKEKDSDVLQLSYIVVHQDKNGKIVADKVKGGMFDSPKEFNEEATKVTGITKDMVKDKEYFRDSDTYKEFKALSEDDNNIFVGHNIRDFDNVVLRNAKIRINPDSTIDTLRLYQNLITKVKKGYKLQDVPEEFPNIKKALKGVKDKAHNANYDTLNNYYLLNYLSEFAISNGKIPEDKQVIEEFIGMSKLIDEGKYYEDTNKSLLQRQIFFEGDKQESIVNAGNHIADKLDDAGFKEGATVGIADVLPFLGNILGEKGSSRTIAMFEGLKKILPEGATIDKNKVFVGGNVKKAYEEYCSKAGYGAMPLNEFVINRIVNSLLTEYGLYNDNAIDALNNYVKRASRNDLLRKLITPNKKGWLQGSTDFTTMGTLFDKLHEDGFIGKDIQKNSPQYQTMMEEFNDYVFKNHNTDLIKFNKSYYDYLTTGDGRYGYTARNIFTKIMVDMFVDRGIQDEDAVIKEGRNIINPEFKHYWNEAAGSRVEIVGEATRKMSNPYTPTYTLKEGEEIINKILSEIDSLEKESDYLKKTKDKLPNTEEYREKRKRIGRRISAIEERIDNLDYERYSLEVDLNLKKKGWILNDLEDVKFVDETEGEAKEGEEVLRETEEQALSDVDDSTKYGQVVSDKEEGASNADVGDIRGAVSNMADTLEGYIWDDLEDVITTKDNVELNNMYHIIETDKTVDGYRGGQFNSNISIDARITSQESKKELIEKLDSLEKKDAKKGSFEEKANAFIYNTRNYLNGQDRRLTDEQYLQVYGLDGIIGKELRYDGEHGGVVTDVKLKANWFDKSAAANNKSEFKSVTLDYNEDFDTYLMLNSIVEASKKGQGTFIVEMVHKTYKNEEDFVASIPYTLNDLWISPIGKALLRKLDIEEEIGRYGNDAVLKTLEAKIYETAMNEKLKGDKLKRDYLDVIEFDYGEGKVDKLGPRRNWSDETLKDALESSGETKWKYIKEFPESDKKRIINDIIARYKEKAMQEAGVKSFNDLSIDTRTAIESVGTKSLDDVDKIKGFFSEGLYSYAKLDEIAKKNGYDSMGDFVLKTAVSQEGDSKARETLGWSLVGDNKFRNEVYSYYNGDLVKLYNNIDDYFGVSVDTFMDRLKHFQVKGDDGTVYKFDAYVPDFMEIEDIYEPGFKQLGKIQKDENGKIINNEFFDEPTFRDYEDVQLIHGDRWVSDEDGLYEASRELQKDNDYNVIKNVNNPSEVVARMYNTKTKQFEYGIIKINDGYYGKNADGQFEGKATSYEFIPFKDELRYVDPLKGNKEFRMPTDEEIMGLDIKKLKKYGVNELQEAAVKNGLLDDSYYSMPEWLDDALKSNEGEKKKYDEIQAELKEIRKKLGEARKLGDLSENAEYKAQLENLIKANGQLNEMIGRLWTGISGVKGTDKGIKKVGNTKEVIDTDLSKLDTEATEAGGSPILYSRSSEVEYGEKNIRTELERLYDTYEELGLKRGKDYYRDIGQRLRSGKDIYNDIVRKEGTIYNIKGDYEGMLGERIGQEMKYDWKKESFVNVLPEGSRKNHIMMSETTVKDGSDIAEMDMLNRSTNNLWKTRSFSNRTNYDFFDSDKDIQQIIGSNSNFIRTQGENLRIAADKFQEVFDKFNYTPEEAKKVYDKIRYTAHKYIGEKKGDAKEIKIDGLPDELVEALNGVAKVFDDGGWTPIHQFANLNKDGMEGMIKNIAHNHMGASLNYFKLGSREEVQNNLMTIIKRYEPRDKVAMNAVKDLMGDPLGTGKMYDILTGIRAMWRFIKYGPLFPLTGVLMLANSFIMGNIRYAGEKRGVSSLMNNPWFDMLIAKAGDPVNVGGKQLKGLGMTDGLNRANEIMFNSNSDLGGSWFDKVLDLVVKPLPESKLKTAVTTALKGGTHSLYDLAAQGSVKTMAFAKALARNDVTVNNIEDFAKKLANNEISNEVLNKILGDTERIYSRFFTNSSTAFFSRHRFSRMYIFNALQGYVINRTDEMVSSVKNCVNWLNYRHQVAVANGYKGLEGTTWKDFVDYLQTDNQELQAFLMNILMSAKMGFYMQKIVDGGDLDTENYRRYIIDTSDYLSSIEANFVYSLLMAPFEGITDYAEYAQNNYDDFDLGQGLTVAGLKTVSDLCSRIFREGKVLNAFMDSIVAYGQTGKVDFAYDVLVKDFQKIANGLGRFQLVEGTNLYGLDNLGEDRDILGQVLFNNDQTSNAGRVTGKLQSLSTVDSILNGEALSFFKDKMLPYLPIIGPAIQNAIGGNGYSFSAAKYDELIHIMDKDAVVQKLNNWDLFNDKGVDVFGNSDIYSDESIGRMYQELTAFDYPNKQQIEGGKFETGYEYSNEPMKEEVFTQEMLDQLGWTEQDLEKYLLEGGQGKNKKAGLLKVMAAAEASRPGSSKIVLSYLASKYENNRIKEITGDKYGSWRDLSVQAQNDLQRETVSTFYPYMFIADKTSWYKAITEYVSGKYELFDTLYKDDNLQGYVNTLGYMDMLMYQQAQDGNVNARYIKNSWSMLSKYFKSEPARINAINYIMHSINQNDMSYGQKTSAKMGVLAANMDFYDKIYKNGMMQALYGEDLDAYNNYVWGVLQDINDIGYETAKSELQDNNNGYKSGYKKRKPYSYNNPMGNNNEPEVRKFVPQAQKYLKGKTPMIGYNKYSPASYEPGKTLDWYWKYYEGLIKTYSDRLVKSKGKKYPAETTESITFKTGSNNKGRIRANRLEFPKHKTKEYRTNVISNLPGSHG